MLTMLMVLDVDYFFVCTVYVHVCVYIMYMLICRHRRKEVVQTTVTKQAYQSSQADVLQQPSQSSSNLDMMTKEYEYIMYGRDQKLPST